MLRSLLALALLSVCATPAIAAPVSAGGYSLELVDTAGRPLQTHYHQGTTYVLGGYGQRYNVRVVNRSNRRIEAVVTVDGRDAINGSQGKYSNRGYIVDPYGSVTIEGFRQNHSNVAAFRFTNPGDSYAGRRGSTANVGVIGLAVFPERKRPRPKPIARRPRVTRNWGGGGAKGDVAGGAGAPMADMDSAAEVSPSATRAKRSSARRDRSSNIGTRYGESVQSGVVEVAFRRASNRPGRVLSLRYDDANGLRAKGVIVDAYYSGTPNPFPAGGFAPPPR
ncbi:MAG: hypothetical protein ACI9U2_003036 [Bradymonadia bacterium]|jgi:hypothetical protein